MPATPHYCELKAFDTFCEQLPVINSTTGLVNAATAIAMHAFPEFDLADVHTQIDALAARILSRARSRTPQALLAHLHDVLFEEEGFSGAPASAYYDPASSFFPLALQTRRGLPITLSLVYKAVANSMGLKTCGVNAPFHFLVRVRSEKGWLLIDPFERGRLYHRDEAIARIESLTGRNRLRHDQFLPPATHREWLRRILDNLCATLERRGATWDLAAMWELKQALDESLVPQMA
jgi:regulator of sirC expression with transglutaminase-like and TPR domain